MTKRFKAGPWPLLLAGLLATPVTAMAQDETDSLDTTEETEGEDEGEDEEEPETILITESTRRTTRLFETPVPITAVSNDSLVERNITNSLTLEKVVPNLKIQDQRTLGAGAIQFTLRGVGNSNFTEQGDPNVGFHIDGIYLARPQAAVAFLFDLERLEVLRGPQGYVFGRNSTVGSINVVTAKPDASRMYGNVEGQLGIYNDRMIRGVVNVPIFDADNVSMAFRAAAFTRHRDSYYDLNEDDVLGRLTNTDDDGNVTRLFPTNPYRGAFGDPTDVENGAGAINEAGLRVATRFKAFDRLTIDGTYELYQNNSAPSPLTTRADPYTAFLDLNMTTDQTVHTARAVAEYNQPGLFNLKYNFGFTDFTQFATIDLDAGVHRYRTAAYGGPTTNDANINGQVTPPTRTGDDPRATGRFLPEDQFFYDAPFKNTSWSHEVQIRSEWDFPVSALLGGFFFREETERNLWIDIPVAAGGVILFQQPSRIAESNAVFGELAWKISDQFELKGGLRYSSDTKEDVNGSRSDAFPGVGGVPFGCPLTAENLGLSPEEARANPGFCGGGPPISSAVPHFRPQTGGGIAANPTFDRAFFNRETFDNLDWAVTFSWTPKRDAVVYAKVATGYKSGGFQDTFFNPRSLSVAFPVLEPENLVNYEVGAKGTFLDGALRVSGDFYLMDYSNKQESILVNFGDLFCPYTWGDFNQDGVFDGALADIGTGLFASSQFDPVTGQYVENIDEFLTQCDQDGFNDLAFPIDQVELVPINLADAITAGLEFEWFWQLTGSLRFSGFLAVNFFNEIVSIDSSTLPLNVDVLTDTLACDDRQEDCGNVLDLEGNRLPYAPLVSAAFNLNYDIFLGDSVLTPGASLNISSDYFLSIWNVGCYQSISLGREVCDNGDLQDAYATLDLNLRYTAPYDRLYVEGYATNVTDTAYATFNRRNSADGVTSYAFNPPRQVGARMGLRF